jgi:hypothetical protein
VPEEAAKHGIGIDLGSGLTPEDRSAMKVVTICAAASAFAGRGPLSTKEGVLVGLHRYLARALRDAG